MLPTNAMISLASLYASLADAQAALDDVPAKIVPWKSKVGDFENIYTDVHRQTTRSLTAFKASGAPTN